MLMPFLVALALMVASPLSAQIIILDTETPEGDGGGGPEEFPGCEACCATNPSWYCEGQFPGCSCGGGGGLCSSAAAMLAAGASAEAAKGAQASLASAGARMLASGRGRRLVDHWLTYDDRVRQLLKREPELSLRLGRAMMAHWPAGVDFAAGASGGPKVRREALDEIRGLLDKLAAADAASGSEGLAKVIRAEVMPQLTRGLVGRSYPEALTCFLEGC